MAVARNRAMNPDPIKPIFNVSIMINLYQYLFVLFLFPGLNSLRESDGNLPASHNGFQASLKCQTRLYASDTPYSSCLNAFWILRTMSPGLPPPSCFPSISTTG